MLPMILIPEVIAVNSQLFQDAGIPHPDQNWSIDEFFRILAQFDPQLLEAPVFVNAITFGTTSHLLQIMLAAGAPLINYQSIPMTVDFTSAETVALVQQTLDLTAANRIHYQPFPLTVENLQSYFYDGPNPLTSVPLSDNFFNNNTRGMIQ